MNKRIFSILLASVMTLMCGCNLAQPEGAPSSAEPDRLVGVFITTEYLDLFDTDAWLQDNADQIADGELTLPAEDDQYTERLYAELTESTVTDSSGKTHTTHQYTFKELDGIILASYQLQDSSNAYWSTDCGEGICDIKTALSSLDNGTLREIVGSLYISHTSGDTIFYFNPVYQTADGAVYLVPGSGLHVSSALGASASQAISSTATVTENGVETTHSSKIEVKIDFVAVADKVVLIQMDENNREIARSEFIPGEMPEEFTPLDNAAYLIIEEHCGDSVSRSLHQPGSDSIRVFFAPDGKLCLEDRTTVNWPK